MMEEVDPMYTKLGHLRALAEDERTPENEARNARLMMTKIEEKIREKQRKLQEEQERIAKKSHWERSGFRRQLKALRNKKGNGVSGKAKIETEWPFGWDRNRQQDIEVEEMYSDGGSILLGWKCVNCEEFIEKVITPRHRMRLSGRPDGVSVFVDKIRNGEMNQLCDECFNRYK